MDTFEKAPHAMLAQIRAGLLSPDDLFAYLSIAELAYRHGGEVEIPQDDLAETLGYQPRMLRYHLTALIEAGWLVKRKVGYGRPCAYRALTADARARLTPLNPAIPVPDSGPNPAVSLPDSTPQSGNPIAALSGNPIAGLASRVNPVQTPEQTVNPVPTGPVRPGPTASERPPPPPPRPAPPPPPSRSEPRPGPLSQPRRPNPSFGARLIDLLRAGGVPDALKPTERDFHAMKSRPEATPELVAECYLAIFRGTYGDPFIRKQLSIQNVVYRFLDGYLAEKAHPQPARGGRLVPGRDVGAPRTGYSGSATGPIDPELRAIFDRDMG